MTSRLSALSIAAVVVQFLDLARSIVCRAKAQYKAPRNEEISEDAEKETKAMTKQLRDLTKRLRAADGPDFNSSQGSSSRDTCTKDSRLEQICTECKRISSQLIPYLGDLRAQKDGEDGKWNRLRQVLKTAGLKQELDAISKKLGEVGDNLDMHVLVILRKPGTISSIRQDDGSRPLDSVSRMIINGWLEERAIAELKGRQLSDSQQTDLRFGILGTH